MLKLARIAGLAALGALSLTTSASAEEPLPIYVTHMYSDDSYTEEVGYISGSCSYRPGQGYYVQYGLVGTYTYYQVDELVGYCPDTPI